jgi:hypothetical protein
MIGLRRGGGHADKGVKTIVEPENETPFDQSRHESRMAISIGKTIAAIVQQRRDLEGRAFAVCLQIGGAAR